LTKLEAQYWSALFVLKDTGKGNAMCFHIFKGFVFTFSKYLFVFLVGFKRSFSWIRHYVISAKIISGNPP